MSLIHLYLLVLGLTAAAFGGGGPLQAGLERELVPTGIMNPVDFSAAVAMGQSTPGPMASFTTAIGNAVLGWPGAVAATLAMMTVSLAVVAVIQYVPRSWFETPTVRGGIGAVGAYSVAAVIFLAYKTVLSGSLEAWAGPVVIMVLVAAGRLLKANTAALMLGAVFAGMLLQGSPWAAW